MSLKLEIKTKRYINLLSAMMPLHMAYGNDNVSKYNVNYISVIFICKQTLLYLLQALIKPIEQFKMQFKNIQSFRNLISEIEFQQSYSCIAGAIVILQQIQHARPRGGGDGEDWSAGILNIPRIFRHPSLRYPAASVSCST